MQNEYRAEQKTSIEVGADGVTLTGNQSDYLGTIIWGTVGLALLLAIALIKWGPKLWGMFKSNGRSDSSLNGKARIEDINNGVKALGVKVDKLTNAVEENALNLESYKTEVEKKFSDKTTVDVEQREKIKALERTVYK